MVNTKSLKYTIERIPYYLFRALYQSSYFAMNKLLLFALLLWKKWRSPCVLITTSIVFSYSDSERCRDLRSRS